MGLRLTSEGFHYFLNALIPDYWDETISFYAFLVHELEHLIQLKLLNLHRGSERLPLAALRKIRFLERGAMRAEGAFYLAFPKRILFASYLHFAKEDYKQPVFVQFATKTLKAAFQANTADEYVQLQWINGRYSIGNLTQLEVIRTGYYVIACQLGYLGYVAWPF